jgi:hypothetical protein
MTRVALPYTNTTQGTPRVREIRLESARRVGSSKPLVAFRFSGVSRVRPGEAGHRGPVDDGRGVGAGQAPYVNLVDDEDVPVPAFLRPDGVQGIGVARHDPNIATRR